MLLSCASIAVFASEVNAPTFLESGSNDLIRFQKGEVPLPATEAAGAVPADRVPEDMLEQDEDTAAESRLVEPEPPAGRIDRLMAPAEPAADEAFAPASEAARMPASKRERKDADAENTKIQGIAQSTGGLYAAPAAAPVLQEAVPALQDAPQDVAPLDDAISARLVTVCLNNPEEASGAKGFDIRRDGPPRYVADIGSTACARFEPTRHTLYLWKTNDNGTLSLILSSRLDLVDADGTQVSLDWLKDR
ncbi:hypothetical protein ACX3M4_27325 [Roseibium sp. M-1]